MGLTISVIMKLSSALTNCFAKSVDVFLVAAISATVGAFVIYLASNVLHFRDGGMLVATRRVGPPMEIPLVPRHSQRHGSE